MRSDAEPRQNEVAHTVDSVASCSCALAPKIPFRHSNIPYSPSQYPLPPQIGLEEQSKKNLCISSNRHDGGNVAAGGGVEGGELVEADEAIAIAHEKPHPDLNGVGAWHCRALRLPHPASRGGGAAGGGGVGG